MFVVIEHLDNGRLGTNPKRTRGEDVNTVAKNRPGARSAV